MPRSATIDPFILAHVDNIKELFVDNLLVWWDNNRRDFPWRRPGITTYGVLVAEVSLKRTTATAATRAFVRIIEKYPTIADLAGAEINDLTLIFKDIGLYNQRAKGLKEAASFICDHYGGNIPEDLEVLLSVPHVGDYVARAVLSFAKNKPYGVVDSNVLRVINRVFAGKTSQVRIKHVQIIVDNLIAGVCPRDFNWALLDFSALVCRYGKPRCNACMMGRLCLYNNQDVDELGMVAEEKEKYEV